MSPTTNLGGLPILPPDQARTWVLGHAGDSRRLDHRGRWVMRRDRLDRRVINDFQNRTGPANDGQNDHENRYGGYRALDRGTAYLDEDLDGLPDAYERFHKIKSPAGDPDGDGYRNLEEFLNGTIPTKAPFVHWSLDDGQGQEASDTSAFGAHPAVLQGMQPWQWQTQRKKEGRSSLKFTGDDDYLRTGPIPFYRDFSVALWVEVASLANQRILDNRAQTAERVGFVLRVKAGHLEALTDFGKRSKKSRVPKPLQTGRWYHVAVTVDRDGVQTFYLNGSRVDRDSISSYRNQSIVHGEPVHVGAENSSPMSGYFNGRLDGIRIYDRPLSAGEVAKLASN